MSRLAVASSITHPATVRIPPNGVIGPRKRNLATAARFQPPSTREASNETHRSLNAVNAKIEPENKIEPPKMAGPANLWVENLLCWEMTSNAIPLMLYIGQRGHNQLSVNSGDLRTMYLAAVTQAATLSGVIPGLLFRACAPKAAVVIPMAAERGEKIISYPFACTQHAY